MLTSLTPSFLPDISGPKRGRGGSSHVSPTGSPSKCPEVLVDLDVISTQPASVKSPNLPPAPAPIKWYNAAVRPGSFTVFGNDFWTLVALKPKFMKGTNLKLLKKYSPEEEVEGLQVMCLRAIATSQFLLDDFAENRTRWRK